METIKGEMARNRSTGDEVSIVDVRADGEGGAPVVVYVTEMSQTLAQPVETFFAEFEIVEQVVQVVFTCAPTDSEFFKACAALAEEFGVLVEQESYGGPVHQGSLH